MDTVKLLLQSNLSALSDQSQNLKSGLLRERLSLKRGRGGRLRERERWSLKRERELVA